MNPKLNAIASMRPPKNVKTKYAVNGRRDQRSELERRIRLHLLPHFQRDSRLATITTNINTFILKRRSDVIVFGTGEDRTERKVSNGEINHELTTLKRILNLARHEKRKASHVPHIPMLKERNVRTGFFDATRSPGSSPTCQWPFVGRAARVHHRMAESGARCYRYSGGMWISKPVSPVWTLTQRRSDEGRTFRHRRPRAAPGGSEEGRQAEGRRT